MLLKGKNIVVVKIDENVLRIRVKVGNIST